MAAVAAHNLLDLRHVELILVHMYLLGSYTLNQIKFCKIFANPLQSSSIHIKFVNYILGMLLGWDPALKLSGLYPESDGQRHQNEYFRPF